MSRPSSISRRKFLQSTAVASAALALPRSRAFGVTSDSAKSDAAGSPILQEFAYSEATAIAVVLLTMSFALLAGINTLQQWSTRRDG